MAAMNGGRPPLTRTDHLIADLWTLTARARWEFPENFDHPARVADTARANNERLRELKETYMKRKAARSR